MRESWQQGRLTWRHLLIAVIVVVMPLLAAGQWSPAVQKGLAWLSDRLQTAGLFGDVPSVATTLQARSEAMASFDEQTSDFAGTPSRIQVFGYDANARLTSEKEYKQADIVAFLVSAAAPATKATSYGYDDVGNRSTKTVLAAAGTESTAYAYDSNDRLTTETLSTATGSTVTTAYTWDGNGNMASKVSPSEYTGYVFDADNRLIEVRRGANQASAQTVARYGYDADGQRVRKTTQADGSTTHFLIDPTTTWPQVVLEEASSGTSSQSTAYTWGQELRQQARGSATMAPTETLIPVQGHLGTTIAALDAGGNAVERYEATAFGELGNQSPKARHQYTGEYWEPETGMTYLRARWYEPSTARLPSVDPALGTTTDARSLNRYNYANGEPITKVDPSGSLAAAEVGVSLNISTINASAAVVSISAAAFLYPHLESAAQPTVWAAIVAAKLGGDLPPLVHIKMKEAEDKAASKSHKGPERHHTVPTYLCGHKDQGRALVTYAEHSVLHAGLSAVEVEISAVGEKAADFLRVPLGRRTKNVVRTLG